MGFQVNSSNVRGVEAAKGGSVTKTSDSDAFTGTRALRKTVANFGDRAPVYTSSGGGSSVVTADRSIRV